MFQEGPDYQLSEIKKYSCQLERREGYYEGKCIVS
jgi:hypothetical protein